MYGGSFQAHAWTDWASEIKRRVEERIGVEFNSLNLNYYRDGNDYIGMHRAVRRFQVRHYKIPTGKRKREAVGKIETLSLAHGSLVVMPAGSQGQFTHGSAQRRASRAKGQGSISRFVSVLRRRTRIQRRLSRMEQRFDPPQTWTEHSNSQSSVIPKSQHETVSKLPA